MGALTTLYASRTIVGHVNIAAFSGGTDDLQDARDAENVGTVYSATLTSLELMFSSVVEKVPEDMTQKELSEFVGGTIQLKSLVTSNSPLANQKPTSFISPDPTSIFFASLANEKVSVVVAAEIESDAPVSESSKQTVTPPVLVSSPTQDPNGSKPRKPLSTTKAEEAIEYNRHVPRTKLTIELLKYTAQVMYFNPEFYYGLVSLMVLFTAAWCGNLLMKYLKTLTHHTVPNELAGCENFNGPKSIDCNFLPTENEEIAPNDVRDLIDDVVEKGSPKTEDDASSTQSREYMRKIFEHHLNGLSSKFLQFHIGILLTSFDQFY